MSLFDCIQRAVDGKEMDPRRGQEAQALFTELRADYAQRVGTDAANAAAAEDVKRIMAVRAGEKRRTTMLRLTAARRNGQLLMQHTTLRGVQNPADALRVFITGDESSAIPGIVPIAKSLHGFYHAELDKILATFSRNLVGNVRNKALLKDVTRELFGQKTGNQAAAEMADAARKVLDRARRDHNAAGGSIGEIENYGLAMNHHARKIEEAEFDAWRDFIWDKLDWARIVDKTTEKPFALKGGLPSKGGRADEFLNEIYRTITTDGWSKREASFMDRGLSVGSRRNTSRVLHFKDGDRWLEYNERFGSEDPFSTLIATLGGYARDTAMMRVLGPNPTAGITYLGQLAIKAAEEAPWGKSRAASVNEAKKAAHRARVMLDLHSGAAQTPIDGHLANFLAGTRAVLVSAQLGGAAISAVTDVGFQAVAARKVGMSANAVMGQLFKQLRSSPVQALRLGLISDQMANVGAGAARYMGEVFTPERMGRLSDFVMRASGLTKWTEAGRHAFQLEFMGFLADNANLRYDAINPALKMVLDRKGFTAADWEVIRKTELHNEDGATFLVPHQLRGRTDIPEDVADDLSIRLMSVLHEQTEFAIPSASLEGQALFLDQTQPGTLIGELARSGFMYKTFGMSVLYNQIRRTMTYEGPWSRVAYASSMMAMVTVMGAISIQMKEIVKGRDPRPMDSWEFLAASILQGGGMGIFGDFLSSESNRFGGGIESTLAGPMFGAAGDLISLGITGAKAAVGSEDANFGREAVQFLRYNTPVTGIWYWQSAFQRGLFDNLQRMMDPEADRSFRDREKRRIRDNRNPAWWGPGEALPTRAPNMGNIAG